MASRNLARKDTTKGPPLRVLSLDGGGVRGYSMLILLQELMHRTYVECEGAAPARDQIPKPCEHFDLIAGTGTGGLIALMLGRLRLDLETCKDMYVRMTRRVFETDKTIAGIPYRSTLFKASKLEEAIRQCVREHTVFESEGNDGTPLPRRPVYLTSSPQRPQSSNGLQRRISRSSVSTTSPNPSSPTSSRSSVINGAIWGNPEAKLYDNREDRTKTAVTAVYKGTPKNGNATFLRSYDSRKEPPPEFNCTIWQAGRATSATGLAFKPIQIGQHVFIDEGAGKYNPAPQVLDEAAVNEWPGREVGIFVSVGTGKRPSGTNHIQHEWWEDFFADSLGNFAEARRRLIAKIEGCEKTHQYMLKEHLAKRNVPLDNYVRLNVEVGVGEFGMNEWNRLADISTSTRTYLARNDVQKMNHEAAVKLAKIHFMHRRAEAGQGGIGDAASFEEGVEDGDRFEHQQQQQQYRPVPPIPQQPPQLPPPQRRARSSTIEFPDAVELPGEDFIPAPTQNTSPPRHPQLTQTTSQDKYTVTPDEFPQPLNVPPKTPSASHPSPPTSQPRYSQEQPHHNHHHLLQQRPPTNSSSSPPHSIYNNSPRRSSEIFLNPPSVLNPSPNPPPNPPSQPNHPPPLPPKTPMPVPYPEDGQAPLVMPIPPRAPNRPNSNYANLHAKVGSNGNIKLPYPDDGPPPLVNKGRKPVYNRR
ncbi:hypothetical protein AJ79_02802 [Helicocarpus griseus UAMH5409]|uniref:PNPLA domain-containing protein n=1 Tax=Helicocarpus griseus UAMH5409 TaxID=1447875 RepID=A0A2B7XZY4_9EURO|nr:hypothetical protein AJ79_02802 [Helicocarpus griseus UAMH5409]